MNTCWVDLKVCTIFRSLSSLIWDCKTHGHLGGMQSSLGHLVRSGSTLLENLIQFLFIFSHFVVSCLDGFQVVDNRICQEWLEGTPIKVLDFQNNVLLGSTRLHCRINVQQICRFRSFFIVPLDTLEDIGLAPFNLVANHVRWIQDIDSRSIIGVTLGHFTSAIHQQQYKEPHSTAAASVWGSAVEAYLVEVLVVI
jgi:hypothetical protein